MSLLSLSAKEANFLPDRSQNIVSDNNAISEPSSHNSTDSENNETPINAQQFQEINENELPTFAIRMLNFGRELAIVCLVMVTYATLTKEPPKITKSPAAYPFFSQDSLITDWYQGQVSKAIEHARSSDMAFVMFYAPWDAESQAARKEFEKAAAYMQDYVSFAAVNCWQPNSECRNQYSKIYRWPVLIAYPTHGRGIQYNGPISAPHMIAFLQRMCNPFSRVNNERSRKFEDVYITAYVNTLPGSSHFAVLYTTVLKYLEKDPLQRISFYVHPQSANIPSLYLHLWNVTLVYTIHEREWRPDEILQWIFGNLNEVTTWVTPLGTKSLALANSLQNDAALLLFTPKNPLYSSTDYYSMLQEIGHEYYNCEENVLVNFHTFDINLKRSANLFQYKKLRDTCKLRKDISGRKITSHLNLKTWANTSSCTDNAKRKDCNFIDNTIGHFCSPSKAGDCIEFASVDVKDPKVQCEKKFANVQDSYKTSMVTGKTDPRSPENLSKRFQRDQCRQFFAAEKIERAIFENVFYKGENRVNITGLACNNNKSLVLVAIDSLLHYQFAEKLGVDLSASVDKSAVLIINEKMESHYIMKVPVNGRNIREFIYNFSKNQLPRSLESIVTLNLDQTHSQVLTHKTRDKTKISILELNSHTFLPTILQENKAVIVFYYTKQCSFCNGISHIFLTAANKLMLVENLLFTRIDGDMNSLPWEYTMDTYPTILFFPANGKSESRVFPSGIPITVPNLIGFILTNLDPSIKLHVMWSICNQTKFEEEKSKCFSSIRAETMSLIDKTLRNWRLSNRRQRQTLLHQLKQLRQLHLLLAHTPQKHRLLQSYFKKLNSKVTFSQDYHSLHINRQYKDEL